MVIEMTFTLTLASSSSAASSLDKELNLRISTMQIKLEDRAGEATDEKDLLQTW